jgi:hypothetical protein
MFLLLRTIAYCKQIAACRCVLSHGNPNSRVSEDEDRGRIERGRSQENS